MARLTQDERKHIIKTEANLKFDEKIKKMQKEYRLKLKDIVEKTVPKWITKKMIDSRYIKMSNAVSYSFGELHADYGSHRSCRKRRTSITNSIGSSFPSTGHSHTVDFKKVKKYVDKIVKLKEEKEDFETKLRRVLNSFNTDKKLMDNVPEFKKYFNDRLVAMALVPIGQIKEVRKMISK